MNERKDPYKIRIPIIWEEIDDLKQRISKLESKSDTYEELWEIRTMEQIDELIKTIREELRDYGKVLVRVEKHE